MARKCVIGLAVLAASVLLTGCQTQQMSMEDMMKQPPRPAELDQLEDLVGKWTMTGECKMTGSDKSMKSTGTSTATWACDRRVVIEHSEGVMGDAKHYGISIYTWDPEEKVYRTWWHGSHGENAEGTMTYDSTNKCWTMKGKTGHGYFKNLGNDNWEWCMSETSGGLFPKTVMEMKGTAKKSK